MKPSTEFLKKALCIWIKVIDIQEEINTDYSDIDDNCGKKS
jgi:hypothetical protein